MQNEWMDSTRSARVAQYAVRHCHGTSPWLRRGWWAVALQVCAALLAPLACLAQSTVPQPVLSTIYPCAVQVGSTAEVTITGADLDGATRLHFSIPGVECKPGAKPNLFILTVAKDATPGYCDVRAVARYGISNPRGFAISKLPVVELKDSTFKSSLGQVIMGKSLKQDRHKISVDAKKGETLRLLCQPWLLDSRMEPVLIVRDSEGSVLARMDASGAVNFTPPVDGSYAIELHDLMYRGDAEFQYLLSIATAGACGLEKPLPLLPSEKPDADLSKSIAIESTYVGWFPGRGKARYFTFTAKKGDVRIIEVRCARLGLRTDPYFLVQKMEGDTPTHISEANDRPAVAAKDEFDGGWADPSYRFEAKADGTYRIKLRDLFGTREPFELSVQAPGTAFELVAMPSEAPPVKKTAVAVLAAPLWRGGVSTYKVVALRERGFTGAITLSAEGMPAGVTCLGGMIPQGKDSGFVTFAATEQAEGWGGAVRILGRNGEVTRVARGATVVRATPDTARAPIYTRLTQEVGMGVVPSLSPLLVEAEAPLYEVAATAKASVPLKLIRHQDFADAVKLTVLGLGVAVPPVVDVAAKGVAGKVDLDIAKLKLAPGDYPVVLQTSAKFKHKRNDDAKAAAKDVTATVHSKPFTLRVKK